MRLIALSCLFILSIFTATPGLSMETESNVKFDLKKANQQFDTINLTLSVQNLNLNNLEKAIKTLESLNYEASSCVISAQRKIDDLNDLSVQNGTLSTPEKHSVDAVYLNEQIKGLTSQQAECRLFSIRAQEALDAYKKTTAKLAKKVVFTRGEPLWSSVSNQSIYLLSIIGAALIFIHYFFSLRHHNTFIRHHRRFMARLTTAWLTACAIIDIVGYHVLAMNLTWSSFLTVAIALITTFLTIGAHQFYLAFYTRPALQQWASHYLGYKPEHLWIEFLILKIIAQLLIVSTGIYFIGETMDFTSYYIEGIFTEILNGVHFASFIIYPGRILTGIVIFCVLFLICRALSTAIIRHHQFEEAEEETQVAFASILTYVGFVFALITGLMIAGFNFTGLAIIAGALSVGIGLGLQSIVNNFVSGLILLIEKPIRPGDRISVDGAEGFVKKIRIRSTQIITPLREDIIIPNSDLITRRVTNYMFSDKNCRISCDISVAYGSNTLLVRDTLLNVANLHEDVVKIGRSKPFVLFRSFGDSNLNFQLWCLIKDVNKKLIVQSDLHYAIEEAFRKQGIFMDYPQQNVHISWPEDPNIPQKQLS